MKKRYIDSEGNFWNGSYIIYNNARIFNPTTKQLKKAGYTEYVAPEPTEEELLERARRQKIEEINAYNLSNNVNEFTINNVSMWLTVDERQLISTLIAANNTVGRTEMTRWYDGHSFTFPLTIWEQMLAELEVYAGDALNVTEEHKAAVNSLSSIADIEVYDVTEGYPTKLNFSTT